MLTSEQARLRLKVLIILTSIITALLLSGAIVMPVSSYYGFTSSSPITCTHPYFILKYSTNNYYLSVSFVGVLSSFSTALVSLIIAIQRLVGLKRVPIGQGEEQVHKVLLHFTDIFFVLMSVGILTAQVPLGYFLSLIVEASRQCNKSINVYWLIIFGAAAVAEILFFACFYIVIRMHHMQEGKVQDKKPSEKDKKQKLAKQIQGQITKKDNDQNAPLLQKQNIGQIPQRQNNVSNQTTQNVPSRFVTEKRQPEPIRATYQQIGNANPRPPQKQIQRITEAIQTEPAPQTSSSQIYREPSSVKPENPQTVAITLNFPNSYPGMPVVNPQQPSDSTESLRNKRSPSKNKIKREQRREVIKESMEEELSSDSDDHYYKRARKNKKRKFIDDEGQQSKHKKRKNNEVDYEKEFDRIPSRFQATPSQPRYVILSPESMRSFYDFVKNDPEHTNRKNRNFYQDKHNPLPQKLHKYEHPKKVDQVQAQNNIKLLKPENYEISRVKVFQQSAQNQRDNLKKQHSIYQKLDVDQESDDGLKKYQRFFRSSRHLKKQQEAFEKKSDYDDYFDLLNNSNAGKKESQNIQAQNYRSISNYSSVLNQQGNGKMPIQREKHHKINLDENRIRLSKSRKSKNNIIDQIRSKYA